MKRKCSLSGLPKAPCHHKVKAESLSLQKDLIWGRDRKKLTKSDGVKTEDYFKERVLVVEEEVLGRGEE
jgi:hypothetical protein